MEVRAWLQSWLAGANVYTLKSLHVDYPPNALVLLAPLSLFTGSAGEMYYALVNVAVCIVAAWSLVSVMSRLTGVGLTRPERAVYMLLLLSFAPVRVAIWNGQTTPLIVMCAFLSIRLWKQSPAASGILLGCAMAKPHVALPFVFAVIFARQWRVLSTAAVAALAMAYAYCASVSLTPFTVLQQYLAALEAVYAGPRFLRAEVDMRPFFVDSLRSYGVGEPAYLAAAVLIGVTLLWLVWHARRNPDALPHVLAAACMASLAVFPFRRYGLLLMAPTLFLLLWQRSATRIQSIVLPAVIAIEALDAPFLVRHVMQRYFDPGLSLLRAPDYINRVAVVILLTMALMSLRRAARPMRRAGIS